MIGSLVPWISSTGSGAGGASASRKLSASGMVAAMTVAPASSPGVSWASRITIWPPLEKPMPNTRSGSMPWLACSLAITARANATSSMFSTRAGKRLSRRASFQFRRKPSR